jgi:hypothetical protein
MPGSVNLSVPSYLPTLFGSSSPGNSLLATLHGYASAAADTVAPGAAPIGATTGAAQQVAPAATSPQATRDLAQFAQALAAAKTPAQLLANPTALKVLLTANGLGDQAGNTEVATRALLSNPARASSPVNKLADPRWLSVTNTYSFATKGLAVLKDPSTIATISNGYAEGLWRTNLNQTTPGLSNALDFQTRASTITNAGQVLGDPTFRAVITTALGIPAQTASQPATAQEQAITSRIDLTQFKSPDFVAQFTQRYLTAARQAAGTPGLATTGAQSAGLLV